MRIPLAVPGDIDAEVLGWLRHAYDENSGPPTFTTDAGGNPVCARVRPPAIIWAAELS